MEEKYKRIIENYSHIFTIKENESIAQYTTLKIGGKVRLFITISETFNDEILNKLSNAKDSIELINILENNSNNNVKQLIKELKELEIQYYFIGAGSDVLFSDNFYDGVVIKITSKNIIELNELKLPQTDLSVSNVARHIKLKDNNKNTDLSFEDIYFEENKVNPKYLFVEAGTPLSYLIAITLNKNLSGLHWFTYIPASVGGGVYNNIHGGKIMFSEYIEYVVILTEQSEIKVLHNKDMDFHYDASRIQHTNEIILAVVFRLFKEEDDEIKKSKEFFQKWNNQKALVQPKEKSAGSTFKNLTEEQRTRLNLPTNAAGYLIQECGLKGYSIGGASIYENHGNFFLNRNNASANDYKALIDYAIQKVDEKYGVILEPEVKFVNF